MMRIVTVRIMGYRAILQNTPCHYQKILQTMQNAVKMNFRVFQMI